MRKPLPLFTRLRRRLGVAAAVACLAAASVATDADPTRTTIERLMNEGQLDAARQHIDGALRARPDDAAIRFLSGVLFAQTGRDADAQAVYRQLIADHPDLPELYNNLAVLHASQGRYDRAREALEIAVRARPDFSTAHENLGDVYTRAEDAAGVEAGGALDVGRLGHQHGLRGAVGRHLGRQPHADPETGIDIWKEDTFVKALRLGQHWGQPAARDILPPMPWQAYKHMTDDDLKAMFAFLMAGKPIKNVVPEHQPPAK